MDVKEFIGSTVQGLSNKTLESLKDKLVGEYLTFYFVDEKRITREVFCEKLADYFEKVEKDNLTSFGKFAAKYAGTMDEVVKHYVPKEPTARKNEVAPPIPRSTKYYKRALEIKNSRNLTMKQLTDYVRIMLCLYMSAINSGMKEIEKFNFASSCLELDKIINALKDEKGGRGLSLSKKPTFNLEEQYSTDTATFVLTMIMYYYIKETDTEGEE